MHVNDAEDFMYFVTVNVGNSRKNKNKNKKQTKKAKPIFLFNRRHEKPPLLSKKHIQMVFVVYYFCFVLFLFLFLFFFLSSNI